MPRVREVPPVSVEEVRAGLEALRGAVEEHGSPATDSAEWNRAYELAQERLRGPYPGMRADAILWRVTLLDALLGWDAFQERHRSDGELPTEAMLEVAASIATFGGDTSFDPDDFEDLLGHEAETVPL